jgi:hypothetical protein
MLVPPFKFNIDLDMMGMSRIRWRCANSSRRRHDPAACVVRTHQPGFAIGQAPLQRHMGRLEHAMEPVG